MKRLLALLAILTTLALANASVTVLERSETSLILEYRLDSHTLEEQGGFVRITTQGMGYPSVSGSPLIPHSEFKIGLPPSGGARASLISSVQENVTLAGRVQPVPQVFLGEEVSQYRYVVDESLYALAPGPLLETLEPGSFRGHGYLPVKINPFSYDGETGLRITTQALIRIDLEGDTGYRSPGETDELSDLFLQNLLNPAQASRWRNDQRVQVNYADFSASDHWIRLETDRDGMYKLTRSQLSAFPLDALDPNSFRLFTTGGSLRPFTVVSPGPEFTEVPLRIVGAEDLSFDAADYIVFYGTNRNGIAKNQTLQPDPTYYNPYSGNTVYWLTFGGSFPGEPLRMETLPANTNWSSETPSQTDQARLETESQRRLQTGFDWYTTRMFGSATAEYEYQLTLSDLDTAQSQYLSFWIIQEYSENTTNQRHYISITVNGTSLYSNVQGTDPVFEWVGLGRYLFYKPVSVFRNGQNTIRITVLRNGMDNLFLNWITVDYTRSLNKGQGQYIVNQSHLVADQNIRYNFTGNPSTQIYRIIGFDAAALVPQQPSDPGFRFVASGPLGTRFILSSDAELYTPLNIAAINPADLVSDPPAVDNLIIAADEFAAASQALADLYLTDFNKHSIVVRQSDIFNQFNGGHPDPVAIRQFIRHVFHNYPTPRLTSVTLIGLGTIDWRNYSGLAAEKNKLMVYQVKNYLDVASDDYYAMLTQTAHPEVAIGRYPVRSLAELETMIDNLRRYTENRQGGWWRNSMVFVADDLFNGNEESYDNYHSQNMEIAADLMHPSVLIDEIYAWEYEYDEFQNKPGVRDDMMAAINSGSLVWFYTGHGAFDKLGAEDYFNGASDMARFDNPDKLPVMIAASCSVSHFDYWGFDSLGQKVVLLQNRGAIASLSSSRSSNPWLNKPLTEYLLANMINKRNPLGYSIALAKMQYTGSSENDATFVLFGDPLLKAIPPVRDSLISVAAIDVSAPADTLYARQQVRVEGQFRPSLFDGQTEIRIFNTENLVELDSLTVISHRGSSLFKGSVTVSGGAYEASFIVPDDAVAGDTGLIVAYIWDPALKEDFVNFKSPLPLSGEAVAADNPDAPQIDIYLSSLDFRPGDTVGDSPLLYARISDSNGVNITGSSGHSMLLVLDGSLQPIPVNDYFSYDLDSFTQGLLTYQLSSLSEGPHTVQLIAFDNFNLPSVATTEFIVKKSGELSLERFLIYPNPMAKETWFTFMLSEASDVTVDIYTLSGKKAYTLKTFGSQGFNKVRWDGRDSRGDRLANNTYFVKIRARSDSGKAEKTERLVIYN